VRLLLDVKHLQKQWAKTSQLLLDHRSTRSVVSTQSVGTTSADGHSFVKQLFTVLKLLQQTDNHLVD
jgi:hypothetical protein